MKKIFISIIVLSILLGGGYIFSPDYLKTAIKYRTPDIDDYKIFENRTIKAGNYIPWEKANDYNRKEMSSEMLKRLEEFEPVAFLIIQDKKIKYEKYWEGYNEDSLSNSFSMAKSIISLLIGIAIDDGYIKSIDQKVSDFIPEYKNPPNNVLSIRDLLSMSSGLNWDESYSSPFSVTTKAYYGDDLFSLIKDLKVVEKPGVKWKYLSGNTQILAFVLKNATGMNVSDYASKKLWKPLGAKNDALWCLDKKDGMEKAYCCFNSNARDFARIGQMVLNKGKFDDVEIISKKYIDEATKPNTDLVTDKGQIVDFYGLQFWILQHKGYKIPFARGILGQYIFIIPEKNAVVVRLGHKRSEKRSFHSEIPDDVYLTVDAAMEILD